MIANFITKTPNGAESYYKHFLVKSRRKIMKTNLWEHLVVVIVLVLLVLTLVGCGASPEGPAAQAPAAEVEEAPAAEVEEAPAAEVEEAPAAEVEEAAATEAEEAPIEAEEKVLVVSVPTQYSDSFDIAMMAYSMETTNMIYDGLVSVDTNYEYQPGLAERWEVSEDGTVVTFYLKQGVKFHDGSDFNAEVVKWWIELMRSSGGCCAYLFTPVTDIEVIDDYTIALTTDGPFPNLFFNLSSAWGLIMSKESYEKLGPDEYATNPAGTGPFMLEEWVPNDHLTLVKNPDYNWAPEWTGHKGPPNVDKIIYRVMPEDATRLIELEAGDVDMILEAPWRELPTYQDDPDYQVVQVPEATLWFIGMNLNAPIVADLRTRFAIGHAIDRELIQETLYLGLGEAKTSYLASELASDKGVGDIAPGYDPSKAAELLAEAGWVMGDDGILVAESVEGVDAGTVFEVSYWTYQDDEAKRLAEVTQNMLAGVGIKANIQLMDNPTYAAELEAGDHQIILRRYTWDNSDIIPWFHHSQYLPYTNYLGVNDPELDTMMDDADYKTTTWAEREDGYREAHKYLLQTYYPWAPIFQRPNVMITRATVKDFQPIPLRAASSADVWTLVDLEE
jgi:peptide/nickel transport system substrate-binding protein